MLTYSRAIKKFFAVHYYELPDDLYMNLSWGYLLKFIGECICRCFELLPISLLPEPEQKKIYRIIEKEMMEKIKETGDDDEYMPSADESSDSDGESI